MSECNCPGCIVIGPTPEQQIRRTERELALRMNEIGEWVRDTCLRFGASTETAWKVGGAFVDGLEREGQRGPDGKLP